MLVPSAFWKHSCFGSGFPWSGRGAGMLDPEGGPDGGATGVPCWVPEGCPEGCPDGGPDGLPAATLAELTGGAAVTLGFEAGLLAAAEVGGGAAAKVAFEGAMPPIAELVIAEDSAEGVLTATVEFEAVWPIAEECIGAEEVKTGLFVMTAYALRPGVTSGGILIEVEEIFAGAWLEDCWRVSA